MEKVFTMFGIAALAFAILGLITQTSSAQAQTANDLHKQQQQSATSLTSAANATSTTPSSVQYTQKVKQLLKQVSDLYHQGNYTGAGKVADIAYLDNFELVEIPLVNSGHGDLKVGIEQMMRVQLREMIKQQVPVEQLDTHIAALNAKLDEAATVLA